MLSELQYDIQTVVEHYKALQLLKYTNKNI